MMIDVSRKSWIKYFLFGCLYFSFGLNVVFLNLILPLYFLNQGISPALITVLISVVSIPMFIKFVWGGIVDYFIRFGRKPFIIAGGLLTVVCLFILSFLNPGNALLPFAIIDFMSWVGVGVLTISLDALVISTTGETERGKINGSMYAAQNVGLAGGSVLLPFIAKTLGYNMVFLTAGFIILPIVLIPLIFREKKIVKKQQKVGGLLIQEFKKKTILVIAIFAVLVMMSSGMILLIAPIWMDTGLQLDITQVGIVTMLFTIAIAIGAVIGGVLADKLGRKTTLYILISSSIFFTVLLVFANSWEYFSLIYCIIGFLQGGYTSPVVAIFYDVTNPRIAATQYAIFISLFNLGITITETISGPLYVLLGVSRVFLYAAWIFGPALLILYFIRLKKNDIH
ncbi:Major Facilitator Superfamily protein [uncultured archaeon]|nr:Major Facilitator Superfamily protein [uncultured archaeon]